VSTTSSRRFDEMSYHLIRREIMLVTSYVTII
jgi:hypothetical protein